VQGRLVQKLRNPSWFGGAAQESIWVFKDLGCTAWASGFGWGGGGRGGGGRGSCTSIERVSGVRDADGNVYTA
jgi:hypothetical protein